MKIEEEYEQGKKDAQQTSYKMEQVDLIDRQAVIDALTHKWDGMVTSVFDVINSLPSAQPELSLEQVLEYCRSRCITVVEDEVLYKRLDSAYTEGYTASESKYRKMWDEMQANIKEKAFGKRKGLIHTADIDTMPTIEERKTGKWEEKHHAYADEEKVIEEWQSCKCSVCGRYDTRPYLYYFNEPHFCSWCGTRMVQEG